MIYHAPSSRTLVSIAVLALVVSAVLAFSRPVEMMVDGVRVESDVPPVTTVNNQNVFVPVRTFAEALGAQVQSGDGDADDRVDIVRGNKSLRLRVGDPHATFNGMPLTLHHAPFLVRGRVMVELKAVAGAFNVRTTYNPRTARIDVLTPGTASAPP